MHAARVRAAVAGTLVACVTALACDRESGDGKPPVGSEPAVDGSGRVSQPARVAQTMGPVELRVVYNRPSARGRALFGALVPWDSVWNPGADEATRLEISHDVLIEDSTLKAGRYSIWAIPRPDRWTVILSRAWEVQHRPYPEGQDALRLEIRPDSAPHMETLAFGFPVAARDSAVLELRWGTVSLPLRVEALERVEEF